MRLPGQRLRAWAARRCSPVVMQSLVDPVLADLQAECSDARCGRWRRTVAWTRCLWALTCGGVYYSVLSRLTVLPPLSDDERRRRNHTLGVAAGCSLVFTGALCVPMLVDFGQHGLLMRMGAYLVPAALPLGMPAGLLCGVLFGMRREVRGLAPSMVIAAMAAMSLSIVVGGWVAPLTNQAFRVLASNDAAIGRGIHELNLLEAWAVAWSHVFPLDVMPSRESAVLVMLHQRLAWSCAPVCVTWLALEVARVVPKGCLIRAGAATIIVLGYATSLGSPEGAIAVTAATAWTPNLLSVLCAVGLLLRRRQGRGHLA